MAIHKTVHFQCTAPQHLLHTLMVVRGLIRLPGLVIQALAVPARGDLREAEGSGAINREVQIHPRAIPRMAGHELARISVNHHRLTHMIGGRLSPP